MKTNSFLLFIGALLLTAACRQEPAPQQTVTVTFQLGLPEDTRAAGDGSQATSLTLFVYDANGALLQQLTPTTWNPSVTVVPGTYSFSFWATSPDADAYSFNGQSLTVDYSKMTMNADTEDAFWACVPNLTVSQGFNQPVQLSRPLGQVSLYSKDSNLGLTATDLNDASKYVSKFTLQGPAGSGIPTQMNLLTGATAAPVAQVAFPESPLQLTALESSTTEGALLAYAYVLAPETAVVLPQVSFSATLKRTQTTITSGSASSVPLQRNHRTRLLSQPQQAQLAPPTISFEDDQGDPLDALDNTHTDIYVHLTADNGASIYYSTDGTTPTENSLKYEDPISVSQVCTIKAIAVKAGCPTSDVATAYVQKHLSVGNMTVFQEDIDQQENKHSFDSDVIWLQFGENKSISDYMGVPIWSIDSGKPFLVQVVAPSWNPGIMITKIVLYSVNQVSETRFETACGAGDYQDYNTMQVASDKDIWTGQAQNVTITPVVSPSYSCHKVEIWYTNVQD